MATAAACAKELLSVIQSSGVAVTLTAADRLCSSPTVCLVPFERDTKSIGRGDIIEIEKRFQVQKRFVLPGIGEVG